MESVRRWRKTSLCLSSRSKEESSEGDGLYRLSCKALTTQLHFLKLMILYRKRIRAEALVMCHRVMQLLPLPTYIPIRSAADHNRVLEERVAEIRGGERWKTVMLIDHSQKHGRLQMRGQPCAEKCCRDRQIFKIWCRSFSCQSLRTNLLFSPWKCMQPRTKTFLLCPFTSGEKSFLKALLFIEGIKSPDSCQKYHKTMKWMFTCFTLLALETSVGFASVATGKISNWMPAGMIGVTNKCCVWIKTRYSKRHGTMFLITQIQCILVKYAANISFLLLILLLHAAFLNSTNLFH